MRSASHPARILAIVAGLLMAPQIATAAPQMASPAISMPDGVALAADVIRPDKAERLPAILVMTRYGRATRMSGGAIAGFTSAGFAIVTVDMRGSGAAQGHVSSVFSREERADIAVVLSWIARQPWSNGRIVATGVSYDANLAALALASGSKALVGAVPRFIDYDTYRDLAVPGGVRNEMLLREWGALTNSLDHGTPCLTDASHCAALENLRPVDGDQDYAHLRHALLDHQRNWHAYGDTMGYAFDDDVVPSGRSLREGFLSAQQPVLATTRVPVQVWGSWFDAATADSALRWYASARNAPVQLYLGAWTHGGGKRVDPFLSGTAEDEAGAPVPAKVFLDFATSATDAPAHFQRSIVYYTAGAAVWRKTTAWPPKQIAPVRWFLGPQNSLTPGANVQGGTDTYKIDFTATTGKTNRWTTQLGGGMVDYGDRAEADRKLLAYTSLPLDRDIEITGAPVMVLRIASTHPDGAVFVYLEAVGPDGKVLYLSESELRLALRGGHDPSNRPPGLAPSFLRADAAFLEPGRAVDIGVKLHTVSCMIPKGYRLRVAIAGADADTFARYPSEGDPVITIDRARAHLDLPQADWIRPVP